MDRRSKAATLVVVVIMVGLAIPAGALAKGPPVRPTETTNNLSFPVIAVDGFVITPIAAPTLIDPYVGTYPGLTESEITALGSDSWYPQKDPDGDEIVNVWQADHAFPAAEDVTWVDWGDNVESVSPTVRRPFRLEVVLFRDLDPDASGASMTAYTMAVLEYPSSANELQGTNGATYESRYATVISRSPRLVMQYFGSAVPTDLAWEGTRWSAGTVVPLSFAPELNVAGKYIYGASEGGWKPNQAGWYRATFYVPSGAISLADARIGDYADLFGAVPEPPEGEVVAEAEGGGATPVVVGDLNLTYADLYVKPRK
jgi:hypothetical protein